MAWSFDQVLETQPNYHGTVLVLDADPDLRRFLAGLLGSAGFLAVQIRNDRELRVALRALRPSLLVIDLALLRMSTVDLLGLLRRHREWRRIPVILVSDDCVMTLPARGDASIIYKPDRDSLVARIGSALRPN